MSEQDTDKSEQATPHKLEEARKRGQVSKSMDVNSVVMLTGFVVVFAATLNQIGSVMVHSVQRLIVSSAVVRFDENTLLPWMASALEPMLLALSPLLMGLIVCAILTNVLQTGPVLTTFPMKPDFSRLNPANGLQRVFNMRTLFELAKMLVKIGLVGAFIYWGFLHLSTDLSAWAGLPVQTAPRLMRHLFMLTVGTLLGVFTVVALMDLLFSKREFMRKMRMSKRELKDEYKRREGDPEIRARRRRLHAELRKRSMALRKVKDADVVVVNPVHYAVALRYRPGTMVAPVVLAMGAGVLAGHIRERARRHSVPVVPNQTLARLLFKSCRLGDAIPLTCYRDVAAVYRRLMAVTGTKAVTA